MDKAQALTMAQLLYGPGAYAVVVDDYRTAARKVVGYEVGHARAPRGRTIERTPWHLLHHTRKGFSKTSFEDALAQAEAALTPHQRVAYDKRRARQQEKALRVMPEPCETSKARAIRRTPVVTTNKCATCKHFSTDSPQDDGDEGWGWCALAESNDGEPVVKTSLAVSFDAEQHSASLSVFKDFGCLQHEPAPSPTTGG